MFKSTECPEACGVCADCLKHVSHSKATCDLNCPCRVASNPRRLEHAPLTSDDLRLAELAGKIAFAVANNRAWPTSNADDAYAATYLAVTDAIRDHRA